jgi:hypothetical protein
MAVHRSHGLMFLIAFPLLLVPFAIYNMLAFLLDVDFGLKVFHVPLLSGKRMDVSVGELLVLFSIILLYFEILKSTQISSRAIMDHVLSMILFLVVTIEFIVAGKAATSTFLMIAALCFVDVVGGFTITIRTAQRNVEVQNLDPTHSTM